MYITRPSAGLCVHDLSQGDSIRDVTYNPAANADFAIAWFYVEPLFRNEVIPIFGVDIYAPLAVATASTAKAASAPAVTASTKATVAKSKSKKAPPASPITPAIALQAKNSLPSETVAPKPATKPAPKKSTTK